MGGVQGPRGQPGKGMWAARAAAKGARVQVRPN